MAALSQPDPAGRSPVSRELPRFALLARAVAGRRVAVLNGAGERSYTDGESIFAADLPEEQLRASIVVQASLLAAGSFEPWVMARLTGRRAVRLRYLTLEAARAAEIQRSVLPAAACALVKRVYDGPVPLSARESLAWAVESRRTVPEAPAWLGTIKPIIRMRMNPAGPGGAPTDGDVAGTCAEEPVREFHDEEETDYSRIMELFSSPLGSKTMSRIMQKLIGGGRSPSENGGGEEVPVGGRSAGPVGPNAKKTTAAGSGVALSAVPVGRRYPEWDFARRRYRPDWCSVAEFDPPHPDADAPSIPADDRQLLRQLARLGLSHERHNRQSQGDSLDLTALVELAVNRAAGVAGDPRVYESRRRTAHDLGVLVLLDATGSTGDSTAGRRVFDQQRRLAARLTSALEELGDRVATYGFFSRGRDAVRLVRVKDFDDRYDHAAERRLVGLAPGGYTRLGAAIRHCSHLLNTRAGTSKMLLVVIGDGFPYDNDYKNRYAQEDSHQALREAVGRGIGCVCVSVGASTDDEVIERVWGEVPHRSLDDPSALALHVLPLFREAMQTAEASRRSIGSVAEIQDAARERGRQLMIARSVPGGAEQARRGM